MSGRRVSLSLRRMLVAAALFLVPLTSGARDALAAVYNITYGANLAAASAGNGTNAQQFAGAGSWHKLFPPSPKFETYIDVASQLGVSFKVNEIASLTFHTENNATNPSNVDFFALIYTAPFVGGDASWYGRRLTSETIYANGYVAPTAGVWNTWTTPAGPNQLTFFDSNHCGNQGFYTAPTLADLNAGAIDWATWPGNPTQGGSTGGPFDYGNQTVGILSFQTGSGWASFEGHLDAVTLTLTNGDVYNIDLEATPDDIYVDDNWVGLPAGTPVGPGKIIGVTAFATVQGGVNAALVGATVHVAAGSYTERVEIAKNITVRGAGKGITIIHSPALVPTAFTTAGPNPNKPIVYVHDASDVKIEDLDIDGDGLGNANYRFIGVAYWRAGGRLLRVNVQEIRDAALSGAQHGVGIYANNDGGGPYALEVAECKVTDFQKNGMTLAGAGLTVNVHDCLVTGSGYTALIAQNGIQLSGAATGIITRCAISEMGYSPATVVASGVLLFGASGSSTVSELNGANAITNVQAPINWYDSNGTMDGIEVSGGSDFGAIFVYNSSVALAAGSPRVASGGPRPLASPSDGDVGMSSSRTPNRIAASYSASVINSCLDGTDVAQTAGIGVYTEGGPLSVQASNNSISDWDAGLTSYGSAITLSANDNSITSNVTAGYDNTGNALAQNAESNWWGAASGPSGDGGGAGDAVLGGNVDFTPFLASGTDLAAGCGFLPPAPTTTALSSDNNPSDCGEKVNLTATVAPVTATGTVDFLDGGISIGTAPVIAGTAILSISSLGGGHHPLTAAYGGDADHQPSVSSQLIQNVHCATTSTVVEPTPCDSMGWSRANMRLGGSVDMTATYPQSGLGSLEFGTTGPVSKADWVRPNGNADLLSTLSTLMVDLYRNSSSTSPAHFAPAVRLLVYNGQALNSTSYLIWEPIYNGVPVYPTNVWTANDLFKANFWQRAFRTTGGKTIDDYNRTLSDWLQPGFIVDGDGDTSVVVGPNARVIGYEIGVGSGWAGTFAGAADNFKIGFGATDSTYNFEPRLVTSTSLAADMAKSFCGGKLTLTATVSPAGAEGVVQFADQSGVDVYFEGFETGLGGDPGWDHGVSNFTAARVSSGTNGVTSATGGFHAEAVTANGSAFGRWGGYSSVFPAAGYTTMVKVYLDVAYAMGAGDQRVDFSSAINNNAGAHRRDFVFNMGTEATGWVISAGNNSGRANSFPSDPGHDPVHITASGWYTLKHRFYDDGGVLACQMSLISPSGTEIVGGPAWKRKDATDVMSLIGGNRYGWFANQELPFFAFDDASLTNGTTLGSAPVVGGVATLSATTLQPGSYSFTATFVPSSCATASSSGKVAVEVNQGSSTLALVASPNPAKSGADLVELEATVSPSVGTGTVEFFDGATSLGTSPVVGGVATLSLKFAGEGDHSLTATYSGDACLLGSSAPKILLTVGSAPSVSIADLSTTESNTGLKEFKFLVTLSSAVTQPVTVDFQTSDGSATLANNDYVATNGTVVIPAGALTDTARVNVRGDTNREGDETFTVTLLNPTKATIADGSATGTIINDDGVPSILHTGVRVAEGHPGLTNIVLTVSLSNPTDVPVTVNWATADSSATLANNDYIPASGQVTILPKQLSTTLVVQAVGDSTNEDWEVFHVLLSNPVNATLGARPWLRVELSNDDTAPVVYIGDVTQLEGDAGTTAFTFRVWLSRGTTFGTPTVTYTTQNGTATTGNNDYNFATGNVVFGPKEREKFVTVFVNGDVNFEPDETFMVKLSNPRFGMGPIGDGTGVGTILNDDPKGCPEVTALTPDPNLVVVGGIAKLSWVANGTDNPVTSIDLFISRNSGTSWEILSLGETNDGTYTWNPVSGPGTNAGINPEFTALLKVVAYDAPGCSTVAVSGPFAIYNTVTDVLVAQFQANPASGGVEVRWELASGLAVESVELERSSSLEGPWEVIAADRRQDGSTVVALDRTVSNGTTYYYRLALRLQGGGGQVRVGPIEISAGSSIASFALGKISPNPSRGMTRISYDLPRETSMRLSVVDVAGREVAVLASGSKGAGSYQAVWSGETDRGRAPAGLYFVRFQAAGVNFVRRLVLTR